MFKPILRALFSAWTLMGLLLLCLLLLIWYVGPLVAIGNYRPLESDTARWIASGVLLAIVVLWIVLRLWQARRGNHKAVDQLAQAPQTAVVESPELKAVRERFSEALQTLRDARFDPAQPDVGSDGLWARLKRRLAGRYLYELPWYLIVGAPGSGKTTALQNAGLQFSVGGTQGARGLRGVGGTRLCDWWFTSQAVLIDTAGRFTTQDSHAETDKATWEGFLGQLKRARQRQPLNGVLVAVSVPELIGGSAESREAHALNVRKRLQELHSQLRMRIPVYLMVSKCDLMAGFTETFDALSKEQRGQPWGFTFPVAPATAWQERFDPEFRALLARLDQGLIDRLQAEPDAQRRAMIYGFPNQFANLQASLNDFLQQVFGDSRYETATPMLRGVYFISGTQEGTPIDRVLGAVSRRFQIETPLSGSRPGSGRSFFLQKLLTDVVFAEQGLAGTDRRLDWKRSAASLAAYGLLATVSIGLLVAWTISWRNNRDYVAEVAKHLEDVKRQVRETPNQPNADLLPLLPALEATASLARVGHVEKGEDAPWGMGFGLYQGEKLDSAAHQAYDRMLVEGMLPRLALRIAEQLRSVDQPESQYEALKAYLMMLDVEHFDGEALRAHIEADWGQRLGRDITPQQRQALSNHLQALLEQGAAVSPLEQDKALVEAAQRQLAGLPLSQRIYNRLRRQPLGAEFPAVTLASAGGPNAQNVFMLNSGKSVITDGVPGLFTYEGYHRAFQPSVDKVAVTLAKEQSWVLGSSAQLESGKLGSALPTQLTDDVRRIYLREYRDTWKAFIDDVRLQPLQNMAGAIEKTRFLAAPDSPLPPMLRTFSRHTTLLATSSLVDSKLGKVNEVLRSGEKAVRNAIGVAPVTTGAPGERIESIVDDEFIRLRSLVTAPDGGKPPIEGVVARLQELQSLLTSIDTALKSKSPPPSSPLPNQLKVEASNSPEPVRSLLNALGTTSAHVAIIQLRATLSERVRAEIGEYCAQAVNGRYPFDPSSPREVTPGDFAALFGPGGRFDKLQAELAPYIDTGTLPWKFRPIEGTPLGNDTGTLPQFHRAQVIREAFFANGPAPGVRMTIKPIEMDERLREFLLDVDGQMVRYDHGPQIPVEVRWPGPKGSGVVRVSVQPVGGSGLVNDGPWALFRMFERVAIKPGAVPEKFSATFELDGRRAVFDVTTSSVRNPLRLAELRAFQCPNGL
ncbi:type VI secretion system membrane subunit TssM [Roseateles sp. NT4]|uniref:type VI secretion system membrane subunit TssM n=1 Tax=Roseateles sp. NT4 TaxID=3453715 RepID=UPI003EEF2573